MGEERAGKALAVREVPVKGSETEEEYGDGQDHRRESAVLGRVAGSPQHTNDPLPESIQGTQACSGNMPFNWAGVRGRPAAIRSRAG